MNKIIAIVGMCGSGKSVACEYFENLGYKKGLCPIAEQAVKEVISIPVHPSLTSKDINTIIKVIKGFKK